MMSSFAAPLSSERALEIAESAVSATPADDAEVTVLGRAGEYTRFAGERIHQPQDITELTVMIKAIVNGHAARTATTSLDRVKQAASEAGRLAAGLATCDSSAGPTTVASREQDAANEPPLWHEDSADFDAAARVELVSRAMRAAKAAGGHAAGMIGRAATQIAVANSAGLARHAVATEASGAMTAMVDDGTAHWIDLGRSASQLRFEESIDAAVRRAQLSRGRIPMPDGEFTVVLGPEAVGELLGFLEALGFSGQLAAAGIGIGAGGPVTVSDLVTIADDGTAAVGLPIPFDIEGTTKHRVPFFTRGVAGEPVTDLATSLALGTTSTGHAHIAREEVPAPVAANVVAEAGTCPLDDLIAGVERGVFVERFWYTRLVDRLESTITGVSRDACFLIEDGQLATPVDTGRFTQSVLGFLATVDGVGDTIQSQPVMNVWNGCVSAPALRGHGFRFGARAMEDAR